jgi:lysyl-tRNA synthetase class 1
MTELRDIALNARAWPFEEAKKLAKRYEKRPPEKGYVLFETGYGPSGLPHIGTFGEVARTTMIRHAFHTISDIPTRLVCFSDDMDGMRKVPDNVPNPAMLRENLQRPLTAVPDPFGEFPSFGEHNNAMLRRFLDTFGFDYEFASATDYYKTGKFDEILLRAAEKYDDIMAIMLPSLREERRQTYSCFLPISPISGRVLYVPMKEVNAKDGTITFEDEDGRDCTLPVTGGRVKLQWKPDFGARWAALDVDFEMYGKDHASNTPIYDGICMVLGGRPPEHYIYELFLDEFGEKIARALHLRALPRRVRREDLEVEGQRAHDRRVADLCLDREPRLFHVPEAADGQAPPLGCDPEGGRRVSPAAPRLSGAGGREAGREPGLAHPFGQPARERSCRHVLDAAQPRLGRLGA